MMSGCEGLEGLNFLGEDVLAEVVREGELLLRCQLDASLAADQRALTFGTFAVTAAGASFGLALANPVPEALLQPRLVVGLSVGLALSLMVSAVLALFAALPAKFGFPGNEPTNWLPEHWSLSQREKRNLKAARIEQAMVLQGLIASNRRVATRQALLLRRAVWLAFATALTALGAAISAFAISTI